MSRLAVLAMVCTLTACTPLRPLDPMQPDAGSDDAGPIERDGGVDAPSFDAEIDAGCDPSAVELCNGIDDDCDSATEDGSGDERVGMPCDGPDADSCAEGIYGACADGALACSDASDDTLESCSFDGADEDCDGMIDEAGAVGSRMFFADVDRDGFGDDSMVMWLCGRSGDLVTRGGDCDDTSADVRPGRAEDCDALDNDCNGVIDDEDPCGAANCSTAAHADHTYQFCQSTRTWADAQSICAGFGYHLATVETAAENDWLIMEAPVRLFMIGPSGSAWIGLRYDARTASWMWTDGTPATFTDWAATEPDQMGCARIRPTSSDWADEDCDEMAFPFICEAP